MPHGAASRAVRGIKSSHVPCIIVVHYLYVPYVASALARKAFHLSFLNEHVTGQLAFHHS